ncbi:peptidase S8/S53 subtilisin kexin sedolisin [Mycolicibacterium moriokaense]|nr:peptidase S8/S53 subtilisin kexin sedolisin [Mycolicibacterium moriokaense]
MTSSDTTTVDVVVKTRRGAILPERYKNRSRPYINRGLLARVPQHDRFSDALWRYEVITVDSRAGADELAHELAALPEVEIAYVAGGPTAPPVLAIDDPRNVRQRYEDAAPIGIDARWAWSQSIDGSGVTFVDLEQGWTLTHEDLAAANITIVSGVNTTWHGHGTAVLGQVVGVDNTLGIVGIAPHANASVVSQWRSDGSYNTAEAIVSTANWIQRGDVLLLEAQTDYSTSETTLKDLPVEVEDAVFDAIAYATARGIVVVEAAGNGGHDLDTFRNTNDEAVFDRASDDFRDSGAIMVGAATSTSPHSRMSFSNFGSRIDCYGWGENITTTGDGLTGNGDTTYTDNFRGTSGASPIISGAALLVQSYLKKWNGTPADSVDMRSMLTDPAWSTASSAPATDRIGVMPDLRAIITGLGSAGKLKIPNMGWVGGILFGIVDDTPGVWWGPNGPRPVDPGWGQHLSPGVRDVLVGLAVHELARRVESPRSRDSLVKSSQHFLEQAVESLNHSDGPQFG